MTFFYVVVQNFMVGFKSFQEVFFLFVMSDVYNIVIVGYQHFFFLLNIISMTHLIYNISNSFICHIFFFIIHLLSSLLVV